MICPECEFEHDPEVCAVLDHTRYGTVTYYLCMNCGNIWAVTVPEVIA